MTIKYLDSKRLSGLEYTASTPVVTGLFDNISASIVDTEPLDAARDFAGQEVASSGDVNVIDIKLKKGSSSSALTGTMTARHYNSSGTLVSEFGSLDISTLTTSYGTYRFSGGVGSAVSGDRVGVFWSGGDSTHGIDMARASSGAGQATNHTKAGSWVTVSSRDAVLTISTGGVPASGDVKPTNVQDNSIFVETDTARRYWFESELAPTFEDDFTSYATQGDADAVWVEDGTGKVAVNITDNDIDFNLKTETTAHGINYDFGVGNVSDTEWIIRYKMNLTTVNTTVMYTYWGLSSVSGSGSSTTRDFIGFNTTGTSFYGHDRDGADDTGGGDNVQNYTLLTGTDYYVTIKRTSATAYAYTLQTGSFSGTTVVNGTGTCASTIVGLRYFNCRNLNNQTTAGNLIGTIDDFEFYNGVTSVTPATWTREGYGTLQAYAESATATGGYDQSNTLSTAIDISSLTAGAEIVSIGINAGTAAGNVLLGLYQGVNPLPTGATKLAETASTTMVAGIQYIDLTTPYVLTATDISNGVITVAIAHDSGSARLFANSTLTARSIKASNTVSNGMPSTWTRDVSSNGGHFNVYLGYYN
jgi:hypothetical protein